MGYCPFFSKFESQYSKLYCDIGPDRNDLGDRPGRAAGAQEPAMVHRGTPRHGVVGLGHGPTTWQERATTRSACAQGRAAPEHGWPCHRVSRDTNFVSRMGATVWCRDMNQQRL